MASSRIAIVGISSRLARLLATQLLQRPGVEVVGICRNPAKVPKELSENSRLKICKAEANDSTALRSALKGVSTCVCCYLGDDSLMIDGQKTLIDACVAEKVTRYFASDFSFDFRNLSLGELPHKDCQLKIMDHLQKEESAGKIKAVHVLNGGFHEALLSSYIGLLNVDSKTIRYWGTGDEIWEVTSMENTAEFAAEAVLDSTAVGVLRGKSTNTGIGASSCKVPYPD